MINLYDGREALGFAEAALRWALAAPFAYSAISKGLRPSAALEEFAGLGLPKPQVLVWPTIVFQAVCALLLIVDVFTSAAALALAGFTVAATVLAHQFWRETGSARDRQITTSLEHLALVAALVFVAVSSVG